MYHKRSFMKQIKIVTFRMVNNAPYAVNYSSCHKPCMGLITDHNYVYTQTLDYQAK